MLSNIYCVVCLLVVICLSSVYSWDVAVTSGSEITFLHSNGTVEGTVPQQRVPCNELRGVAFDSVTHRLFITGSGNLDFNINRRDNLTRIFSIELSTENMTPFINITEADDHIVQGIAYDSVTKMLFWTESDAKRILRIPIGVENASPQVIFTFEREIPQGIAIDSCRGNIYWTNLDRRNSSIEMSTIDGKDRRIIINDNLFTPMSIAIDQSQRKIFWADDSEGIHYRIESADLDGSNRKVIVIGRHQQPFGISVGHNHIFWTDWVYNAVWSIARDGSESGPQMIHKFLGNTPMGIASKNYDFIQIEECGVVRDALSKYNESTTEIYHLLEQITTDSSIICFNDGVKVGEECKCKPGFKGKHCEMDTCHNFCFNGECSYSSLGQPQCKCNRGYSGLRCERDICEGYCLNGGTCLIKKETDNVEPSCKCEKKFMGMRCEHRADMDTLCRVYCEQEEVVYQYVDGMPPICRCASSNSTNQKLTSSLAANNLLPTSYDKPLMLGIFVIITSILIIAILVLLLIIIRLKQRPRIKKRFIVNKSVTPLTCRPLPPTEQCEITIENCCNMNICETPCFEPPHLRTSKSSKTEEKKTLLASMENGDEIY